MLDEGIKSLVMREPELEVATIFSSDPVSILEEVLRAFPDVIVLSETNPQDWSRISELLHGISPQETLRVIIIKPDDDILEVYDKQCLKATHNHDLITLITHR